MKPDQKDKWPSTWPEGMAPARPAWRMYTRWEPIDAWGQIGRRLMENDRRLGRARLMDRISQYSAITGVVTGVATLGLFADIFTGTHLVRSLTDNHINIAHGLGLVAVAVGSMMVSLEASDISAVLRGRRTRPSPLFEEISF